MHALSQDSLQLLGGEPPTTHAAGVLFGSGDERLPQASVQAGAALLVGHGRRIVSPEQLAVHRRLDGPRQR